MINTAHYPHCYICGETENLTNDHIPPESFFPKGQRQKLFTAHLCHTCHEPLSRDDEVMRFFLSMVDGVSKSGRQIWESEAYPRMQQQPKLWSQIQKYLKIGLVETSNGIEERLLAGLWQSRAIPFIRRLTRGFLYLFYPDCHQGEDIFIVNKMRFNEIAYLLPALSFEERGIGVFEMWHGMATDTKDSTIWIYRFYESTCFACLHGNGNRWKQNLPTGYKEWSGLPKHL